MATGPRPLHRPRCAGRTHARRHDVGARGARRPARAPGRSAQAAGPPAPGKGDAERRPDRRRPRQRLWPMAAPGDRLSGDRPGIGPRRRPAPAAASLQVDRRYRIIRRLLRHPSRPPRSAPWRRVPGVTRVELERPQVHPDGRLRQPGLRRDGGAGRRPPSRTVSWTAAGSASASSTPASTRTTRQLAGRVVGWQDWVNGHPDPYDDHGHGTHVAGIAAGEARRRRRTTGLRWRRSHGASIISAKVLDSHGVRRRRQRRVRDPVVRRAARRRRHLDVAGQPGLGRLGRRQPGGR